MRQQLASLACLSLVSSAACAVFPPRMAASSIQRPREIGSRLPPAMVFPKNSAFVESTSRDNRWWSPIARVKGGSDSVKGLWKDYESALEREPLRVKTISSTAIAFVVEIIAQVAGGARGIKGIDQKQLFTNTLVRGLYIGPVMHRWHDFLDRLANKPEVEKRLPAKWGRPLFQLLVDQTLGTAIVNAGFLLSMWVVQAAVGGSFFPVGDLLKSIVDKFKDQFVPTLKRKWRIWPVAHIISFAFVPLHLRVLFGNAVAATLAIYKAAKK